MHIWPIQGDLSRSNLFQHGLPTKVHNFSMKEIDPWPLTLKGQISLAQNAMPKIVIINWIVLRNLKFLLPFYFNHFNLNMWNIFNKNTDLLWILQPWNNLAYRCTTLYYTHIPSKHHMKWKRMTECIRANLRLQG